MSERGGGGERVTRKLKYKVILEAVSVCHKGRAFLSTRRSISGSDSPAKEAKREFRELELKEKDCEL